MTYKILALGGGGVKGILHIGALKVLEEDFVFEEFYGCSVGAAFAIALAFGLNAAALERMSRMFSSFSGIFFTGLTLPVLFDSLGKKGLFSMTNLELLFHNMFMSEGLDLRNKLISDAPKKLRICSTNITKRKLTVFQGNFPVLKALMASTCIPIIFHPQEINGSLYIDGGYLTNIILDFVPQEDRHKTLSISIIHDEPHLTPKNTLKMTHVEFLYNLYKISCIYERLKNPHKNNIDLNYSIASGISDIGEKERSEMILRGEELTRRFQRSFQENIKR